MGKILIGVAGVVGVLMIIGLANKPLDDPNARSLGYVADGGCMSGHEFNRNAATSVRNTDWSKVDGAATFTPGLKSMIGGATVFDEMARLGTPACPDLQPVYTAYLRSKAARSAHVTR